MLKNWPGLSNQNYRSWININWSGAKAVSSASAYRKLYNCMHFLFRLKPLEYLTVS